MARHFHKETRCVNAIGFQYWDPPSSGVEQETTDNTANLYKTSQLEARGTEEDDELGIFSATDDTVRV